MAKSAAATANWMKRSIFLTSFFSTQFERVEALHLTGEMRGVLGGIEEGDGPGAGTA